MPDIQSLQEALLAQKAKIEAEGPIEVRTDQDEHDKVRLDEDAAPLHEMGQAIASARNKERAQRLVQIEIALRRISEDPDGFGICEVCKEEIPDKRLLLMPWTRRCVACQSRKEIKGPVVRRKVTDYKD